MTGSICNIFTPHPKEKEINTHTDMHAINLHPLGVTGFFPCFTAVRAQCIRKRAAWKKRRGRRETGLRCEKVYCFIAPDLMLKNLVYMFSTHTRTQHVFSRQNFFFGKKVGCAKMSSIHYVRFVCFLYLGRSLESVGLSPGKRKVWPSLERVRRGGGGKEEN